MRQLQQLPEAISISLGSFSVFLHNKCLMTNKKAKSSAQDVPYVESSDSKHSYRDSDSESDEDVEEEINVDVERVYSKVPAQHLCVEVEVRLVLQLWLNIC
ncbi:hypothetical protein ACET3Z_013384 [Daucus carota]